MKGFLCVFTIMLLTGCVTTEKITDTLPDMFRATIPDQGTVIDKYTLSADAEKIQEIEKKPSIRPAIEQELVKSNALSDYLNGIKEKLLKYWPRAVGHEINIYVTTSRAFIAYSTPWDVVLSLGVLTDVDTEDELAFIIGHELSHILLGHHSVPEYFDRQKQVVDFASRIAMVAANLENMDVQRKGDTISIEQINRTSTQRKMRDAYKIALAVNTMSKEVISSKLSRKNEEEADLLGTDLIVKAGYHSFGYGKALQRVESSLVFTEAQIKRKKDKYQSIVTTLSEDEIPRDNELKLLAYLKVNELCTGILKELGSLYYDPNHRKKSLAKYIRREYLKERRRKFNERGVKRNLRAGEIGVVLDRYFKASEAMRSLRSGEVKLAETLARQSVSGPTSNHSYPRFAFSQVRSNQGNVKKAAANLNMIGNWETSSIKTIIEAARLNQQLGRYTKALNILDNGGKALGAESYMYPQMILVHKKAGDIKKAKSIWESCSKCEDGIKENCRAAAGDIAPPLENENPLLKWFK